MKALHFVLFCVILRLNINVVYSDETTSSDSVEDENAEVSEENVEDSPEPTLITLARPQPAVEDKICPKCPPINTLYLDIQILLQKIIREMEKFQAKVRQQEVWKGKQREENMVGLLQLWRLAKQMERSRQPGNGLLGPGSLNGNGLLGLGSIL